MDEPLGLPVDPATAPAARPPSVVEVRDGDTFELRLYGVAKTVGDATFGMLSYNGSIPGPMLRVREGSEILVHVRNELPLPTTVHWHGVRLRNEYDGVPNETQAPIPPGGEYTHRLVFPDPGLFWYHPHIREDYEQELGLYGNLLVDPSDPSYWPSADREMILTLDDILIEGGKITAHQPHTANFAAMGRYGNVLLVAGEVSQSFDLRAGEVVRLFLTNTANTRVFNVTLRGALIKLVGGDAGRCEREHWVENVVIAPSERVILDVLLPEAGSFELQHVTPTHAYTLAQFAVAGPALDVSRRDAFDELRTNAEMLAERERITARIDAPPDKTLALVAEMLMPETAVGEDVRYACPMHPEIVREQPGTCPKCGMKLMPIATAGTGPTHEHTDVQPGSSGHEHAGGVHGSTGHKHDAHLESDGIEWEDHMLELNRMSTPANMRWRIVDRETGATNTEIAWRFPAGSRPTIRIINELASDHPMHHPFHVHGQRFLVLARNSVPEPILVWKDTVLIRTGEVVDIELDASNPGRWMAHCHIAEHMEAGMMFSFDVTAPDPR